MSLCYLFWIVLMLCWSWKANTLATWCKELTHLKRPWCWERLKAGGEGDDKGWDGWMASLTQGTWAWVIWELVMDFWKMSHLSLMLYFKILLSFIFILFTSVYIFTTDISPELPILYSAMPSLLLNLFLFWVIINYAS